MEKKQATSSQKETAYRRLERATNEELAQLAQHTLGYNPFDKRVNALELPRDTRRNVLGIFKKKIQDGELTFDKHD